MMREKATGNLEHTPESRQIQTNYLKIDMTVTFDKQWGRNRKNVSKHMVFKRQITRKKKVIRQKTNDHLQE